MSTQRLDNDQGTQRLDDNQATQRLDDDAFGSGAAQLPVQEAFADGKKTGEVWGDFDGQYNKSPFNKADENGYEIRFYDSEKPAVQGKDVHVGFLTESAENTGDFTTIAIPAAEYAVFDVYVAKGYDCGNAEMDQWLADNSAQYKPLTVDGVGFVVECYNEKFKDGDKPDSVVEVWVPVIKI